MNDKLIASMISYAKRAADNKLVGNGGDSISVKENEKTMYITKNRVDFANLEAKDVVCVDLSEGGSCPDDLKDVAALHRNVYAYRPDIACIFVVSPAASRVCADVGAVIPPVLDDMAQIVGPTARTAKDNSAHAVLKALKGRGACMLKNVGALATGRTLDEAYTNGLVLDKAAHTYIMATAVGGCKPVGKISAFLEHFVYQKKYSKANQEALLKAQGK